MEATPKAQNMTCNRTTCRNYGDELQKKNRSKSSLATQAGACVPHLEMGFQLRQGWVQSTLRRGSLEDRDAHIWPNLILSLREVEEGFFLNPR